MRFVFQVSFVFGPEDIVDMLNVSGDEVQDLMIRCLDLVLLPSPHWCAFAKTREKMQIMSFCIVRWPPIFCRSCIESAAHICALFVHNRSTLGKGRTPKYCLFWVFWSEKK